MADYSIFNPEEKASPISETPPTASPEQKAPAVAGLASTHLTAQHQLGQGTGALQEGDKKIKSEKECTIPQANPALMSFPGVLEKDIADGFAVERERKKAEKAKKFAEKKSKAAESVPVSSKAKEKKAKAEAAKEDALPEYLEETPVGEKKSIASRALLPCSHAY